jgi:predicted kinase
MPQPEPLVAVKTLAVFMGMTASGKSTLAMAWAKHCRAPYYNTDRVRKELAGLQASDRRPDGVDQGIYSPGLTMQTYQAMVDRAAEDFASDAALVVLDGSYGKRADRERVREAASVHGAQARFIFCVCSEEEVKRRLAARALDANAVSDGRWEIYLHQVQNFEAPAATELDCVRLDTEQSIDAMLKWLAAQPSSQG